jgi:hypothetical protein
LASIPNTVFSWHERITPLHFSLIWTLIILFPWSINLSAFYQLSKFISANEETMFIMYLCSWSLVLYYCNKISETENKIMSYLLVSIFGYLSNRSLGFIGLSLWPCITSWKVVLRRAKMLIPWCGYVKMIKVWGFHITFHGTPQ